MRIAEPIETNGMFWLPDQSDTKLPGTLNISDSGEITLQLEGVIGCPPVTARRDADSTTGSIEEITQDRSRIVGIVQQGGPVTLDRCLWRRGGLPFPGQLSTSTFSPRIAFVGAGYGEKEEPIFSEFSFTIEGLDAWLSITGIEIGPDPSGQGGLIRYCAPDDIPINLAPGVELKFRFGLNYPKATLHLTEASVQQTVEVAVKLAEPRPVEYFHSIALKLCNFLTLALDQAVSIQSMKGHFAPVNVRRKITRQLVHIYGQYGPWPEKRANIRWFDILFRYQDVAKQCEPMIVAWIESHERFEPAFNLYFAMKAQPSQFLDVKILWLCQALETLHRRSSEVTEDARSRIRQHSQVFNAALP